MQALVLHEPLKMTLENRPEPREPAAGQAMLRVRSIGICGSDLHAFRGHHPFVTYPRVLGHELGCEVLSVPPNERGIQAGDRVCVEPILNCGECWPCRQGRYNCCTRIKVLGIHTDGGMTELLPVPVDRIHKASVDLTFDELALCETLSIGVQAAKRGQVGPGRKVAVIGAGPIGLGALIASRALGASVAAIDPSAKCREIATAMGAELVIDPAHQDPIARIQEWSSADGGAHVVLEAVGHPATIAQTVHMAAPTGSVVVIGISKESIPITLSDWMRKEVAFLTTRNSDHAFGDVLALFAKFRTELGKMITHHFDFAEAPKVFSWLHESRGQAGVIKAILHRE